MKIEFSGEAYDTQDNVVGRLAGFTVEVRPLSGKPFDAVIVGPADGSDLVHVRLWDEDECKGTGPTFAVEADEIYVY
jgi:hypothetical protein